MPSTTKIKDTFKKSWLPVGLVTILIMVIATRFLCRQQYLHIFDSVGFVCAVTSYDPLNNMPHPMGYLYYIGCGKVINLLLNDPMLSLQILSILASLASVLLFFFLCRRFVSDKLALGATFAWAANPLFWYYGCLPLTYIFYPLISLTIGWFILPKDTNAHKDVNKGKWFMWAGLALGILSGFRFDIFMTLGPVLIFATALRRPKWKYIIRGILLGAVAFAGWYVWVNITGGGFTVYRTFTTRYTWSMLMRSSILSGITSPIWLRNVARTLSWWTLALAGTWIIIPFALKSPKGALLGERRRLPIALAWISWSLFFFVFMGSAVPGFLLLVSPATLIVVLWLSAKRPFFNRFGHWWLSGVALVNIALFLLLTPLELTAPINYAPGIKDWSAGRTNRLFLDYCFGAIEQYDRSAQELTDYIKTNFTPDNVILMSVETSQARNSDSYGYLGFYLPEYPTVIFPMNPETKDPNDILRPLDFPRQFFPNEILDLSPKESTNYLLVSEGPLKATNFDGANVVDEQFFSGRYFCRWIKSELSVRKLYEKIMCVWNDS